MVLVPDPDGCHHISSLLPLIFDSTMHSSTHHLFLEQEADRSHHACDLVPLLLDDRPHVIKEETGPLRPAWELVDQAILQSGQGRGHVGEFSYQPEVFAL